MNQWLLNMLIQQFLNICSAEKRSPSVIMLLLVEVKVFPETLIDFYS